MPVMGISAFLFAKKKKKSQVYLTDVTATLPPTRWCVRLRSRRNPSSLWLNTGSLLWRKYTSSGQAAIFLMLQCKEFGCFNMQGKGKKGLSFSKSTKVCAGSENLQSMSIRLENCQTAKESRRLRVKNFTARVWRSLLCSQTASKVHLPPI